MCTTVTATVSKSYLYAEGPTAAAEMGGGDAVFLLSGPTADVIQPLCAGPCQICL